VLLECESEIVVVLRFGGRNCNRRTVFSLAGLLWTARAHQRIAKAGSARPATPLKRARTDRFRGTRRWLTGMRPLLSKRCEQDSNAPVRCPETQV
jgi:hypothetical protein